MRRKDKEIADRATIDSIIRESLVCRLAMADNEKPYIVPLCFGYKNNALYFHTAREGKKIDILKKNRAVCFEFDVCSGTKKGESACEWGMNYKSVVGFGEATLIEDPDSKRRALDIIMHQYGDGHYEYPENILKKTLVIRVDIKHLTGKQSS
jgi:nitroimidazol reductase NimA-like FMN-containing flavoprotein (pyridoxamine 5'-phosphate oxidase superfamily)